MARFNIFGDTNHYHQNYSTVTDCFRWGVILDDVFDHRGSFFWTVTEVTCLPFLILYPSFLLAWLFH
jgi:hypothetical protein